MDRFKFRFWVEEVKVYLYSSLISFINGSVRFEPKNIEQCTGLKDINGKLIYEGDVVKTRQHTQNCIVVWFDKDASFSLKSTTSDEYYPIYCYDGFEVIGNIHENPELMEEVK